MKKQEENQVKDHHSMQDLAQEQVDQADARQTDAVEQQADGLEQRIAELEAQLAETQEQMIRRVADMENYRKRLERERQQTFESARTDAVGRFLPVFDDLRRSLDAAAKLDVEPTFLEGVQMVSEKFAGVLAQYDVTRIDEVMVPFDVEVHEALLRQKHDDPTVQPNTVILILEPGYRMGEKVIRHAKVMVSE